jgi:hypothetical protein
MRFQALEFYEGAALHRLLRKNMLSAVEWTPPFFKLNGKILVYLKHTRGKVSPWSFTVSSDEQEYLRKHPHKASITVALICGADGVAAVPFSELITLLDPQANGNHIACKRRHAEFYSVSGPLGVLDRKVPPSNWERILGTPD